MRNYFMYVQFFKPSGDELTVKGSQLSHTNYVALVPLSNVLKIVESFKKKSLRTRNFNVNDDELNVIKHKFVSKMQNGDE